jgi:hypothetical protein
MPKTRREILRLEVRVCIGCAILGGAFLALGGTMGKMALFLLGWSAGCAFHLLTIALQDRWSRRRTGS